MLLRGCVGFGVGVGVWVKWVLPWRGWDLVRCSAGVFFLKVSDGDCRLLVVKMWLCYWWLGLLWPQAWLGLLRLVVVPPSF